MELNELPQELPGQIVKKNGENAKLEVFLEEFREKYLEYF